MEYIMKRQWGYCRFKRFTINKIDADEDDFVDQYGRKDCQNNSHHCNNMQATPKEADCGVLSRYDITISEYNEIVARLIKLLSLGSCNMSLEIDKCQNN